MKKVLASALAYGLPALALAQGSVNTNYWTGLLNQFSNILNSIVVILVALAVVYFIWNVFKYIRADDGDKKSEAASSMIMGIVALAVIVSVWGLVALLQNTFGIQSSGASNNVNNLLPKN